MRTAIVGGGLAGALLAWRLAQHGGPVEVFAGPRPAGGDATGASGGLVRGFETDPHACRLATESLAELLGSETLREWSGYRPTGSVYLCDTDPGLLPPSAVVATGAALSACCPLRGLPAGTVGIVEQRAGWLSPARLRAALLSRVSSLGGSVHDTAVTGVSAEPAVRLAGGTTRRFDAVVVAAGAWSGRLLGATGLRTKKIQYSVYAHRVAGLGAFVDETTGLYGRPGAGGTLLLGLPADEWDVDPAEVRADPALAARVSATARQRLGGTPGPAVRTVASVDCYTDGGLALRPVAGGLFSFTGGSGGAAKTALAASRHAADTLLDLCPAPGA